MKYIRTKNGIYEVVDTYEVSYVIGYTEDGFEKKVYKEDVIKQADTIEMLCDEFVLYDNQLKTYGVFDKMSTKVITFKWIQNHLEIYNGMTIYGAIWTSKGLIFVVKMNKEGVLCLI